MNITLETPEDTEALGAALWQALPAKCLLFLYGDLGAGKTTLVRGLLRAAGHSGAVKSPTYTLVEEYEVDGRRLFHFDLYRLKDPEELEWMGMDDYLNQNALCCIEWPQMGAGFLPNADVEVSLNYFQRQRTAEINVLAKNRLGDIKLNWKNNNLLL
ncbi:tRNA (adenosine(37)-N6)-threonylcarbamoyltransferase complex ATPase subunit type 1 TsaE [Methylomonas sp. LW13]|uniref:tRNA (adenosine(37)-N6)-threonylcarbamoyltransferase complex ATPase subunit type 1 TsaE n=1 Tax=unclassified Methylomonas TaxID=2608980 RepID=UPI00051B0AB5|nr:MULTISPECIES: tRNA (adenosine(37)-N6)-threonylcarbamoyltransferase complex ATPase subunit type 1 TsaE [unclassified Methylomonas]PKD42047.1 tRNA (adenosine(37)-N6)-threonylcarbamoyltransferase complex ATPase subunit type 1 TsaE [Methylomonas sp. Kb3]QBC26820.1 tRNA (adenosine(37)-N6)-threonylcarbamoyltransferase complex ATPase subunit type 1 TsaE [Methylomonas sp. LW13]